MFEVPASYSSAAAVALHELQDICRSVTGELHTAIGTGAQDRYGICLELASDHIGNTVTDCLKKECNSIQSQFNSARVALAQLRSVSKMSASLADISRTVSENRTLTLQVSDLRTEVSDLETEVSDLKTDLDELQTHSSSQDAEVNVLSAEVNVLVNQLSDAALARADLIVAKDAEKDAAIQDMASYLVSYISGALPNDTLIGKMQSKFGLTISTSIFPPASLPTPTLLVPPIGGFPSTTVGASSISSAGVLSTATPGAASVISGVLSSAEPVVGATGVASNGVVPVFSSAAVAGAPAATAAATLSQFKEDSAQEVADRDAISRQGSWTHLDKTVRKAQTLTDEVSSLNSDVSNLDSEVSSFHLDTGIVTLGDELTCSE